MASKAFIYVKSIELTLPNLLVAVISISAAPCRVYGGAIALVDASHLNCSSCALRKGLNSSVSITVSSEIFGECSSTPPPLVIGPLEFSHATLTGLKTPLGIVTMQVRIYS